MAALLRSVFASLVFLMLAPTMLLAESSPLDPGGAPAPVRHAVFRAEAAFGRADAAEAVSILREALAEGQERDHPALRYRLGAYLLELGQAEQALPHLEAAALAAPDAPPVWADLARAAYDHGAYARAAEAFGRAHATMDAEYHDGHDDHAPPDPTLLYYSGVSWILADRCPAAVDVLAPLVTTTPDTVPREWVQALVSAAAEAQEPARAEAGVQRLLRDHPSSPAAWVLASQQSQITSDVAEAALRLQVADWLSPLAPRDLKHLANLYGAAELPRPAARCYERLWPTDPNLARQLAVSWMQAHEPDSARAVLQTALEGGPSNATELWTLMGDLEFEVEHWTAAQAAYGQATGLDAGAGRAWLMQGACALKLDDRTAARGALERAEQDPQIAREARRLLGYLDGFGE